MTVLVAISIAILVPTWLAIVVTQLIVGDDD